MTLLNGRPETLALILALLSALAAWLVPAYFARRKPGYSHTRHTISELGERGSVIGQRVSWLGFVPIGLLVWAWLGVTVRVVPSDARAPLLGFAFVGLGYVGAALFRCDEGAPAWGSVSNQLHNLFGAGEYLGAAAAFSMLGRDAYWAPLAGPGAIATGIVLVGLWGISLAHGYRGLVQRIVESVIFGGIVAMALRVWFAAP